MGREFRPDRQQVFFYNALALAAGETIPQGSGGAAAAYNIVRAAGMARVTGFIQGSTAAAAGFPRIRFWQSPGDASVLTPVLSFPLSVDPSNALSYTFNEPLWTPFFTIEWTQGAAPGTVTGSAFVYPDPPGGSGGGGGGGGGSTPIDTPLGYEQLTVAAVSIGLASIPAGAQYALMTVETAAIRYRDDGVAPTAAVGMPIVVNQSLYYNGGQSGLQALRFIRQTGVSGVLNASYYG